MGIAFKGLFVAKETSLESLSGKALAIDSYNMLYQFLTTIRSRDGSLFTDSNGAVTSHLIGLFSRVSSFANAGLDMAFVFDGKPPHLKKQESERRKAVRAEAEQKYTEALKKQDTEEMKKFASRSSRLSRDMVEEAKKLIFAFGMPVVDAPSEGEAQAAYIVKKGHAYASVSQDFDSLVHGTPKLVRDLSLTGRRKQAGRLSYSLVAPQEIDLEENLSRLGISQDQLIALAMLVGTDYNPGGIKGIGPMNALKMVKMHKNNFDSLFDAVKWPDHFDFAWEDVFSIIKDMPVTDDYRMEWHEPDAEEIRRILVDGHDFSEERVESTLSKLCSAKNVRCQKGLSDFF